MGTHFLLTDVLGGDAVHEEAAFLRVVEAHKQVDDRGLAASGRADEGDLVAGADVDGEARDDVTGGIVTERDVLGFEGQNLVPERFLPEVDVLFRVNDFVHAAEGSGGDEDVPHRVGDLVEGGHVLVGIG